MLYGPRLEFVRKAETVNARKHYTVHGYMIGIPNFLFISRSLFYLRMWYIEEDLVFRRVVHILSKALITNIIVGFINRYHEIGNFICPKTTFATDELKINI